MEEKALAILRRQHHQATTWPEPLPKCWNYHQVSERRGEGNGTPLQYSCLENPMDGGAWWAAVHGVARSQKRLIDFTFTFHFHALEEEMATHSQCSCLENPRDGGAWWAAVYGVAQSQTRLKRLRSSSSSSREEETEKNEIILWDASYMKSGVLCFKTLIKTVD